RERDPTYGGDSELKVLDFDEADQLAAPQEPTGKPQTRGELRIPGGDIARELSLLPEVARVALFGSVVEPTIFSPDEARQCTDVDLAVWLTDLSRLSALRSARG